MLEDLSGNAAIPVSSAPVLGEMPKGLTESAGIEETCAQLVNLQRRRRFAIKMQSKIDRAVEAYIRTLLGFSTLMPEKDRRKLSKLAQKVRKAIVSGVEPPEIDRLALQNARLVVIHGETSRKCWDDVRGDTEREMTRLAETLPAMEFIDSVCGVTSKVIAVIVGEAGNLSNYPDRSRLQKRLGLGVVDGVRQGNPGKNASADDWAKHGYNPHRRAEVWAFLDDTMLRAQWRGPKVDKDGEVVAPGRALGPYGAHYARKKAEYVLRGHPTPDRAARRYMAKIFIRDLWKAWVGGPAAFAERSGRQCR